MHFHRPRILHHEHLIMFRNIKDLSRVVRSRKGRTSILQVDVSVLVVGQEQAEMEISVLDKRGMEVEVEMEVSKRGSTWRRPIYQLRELLQSRS